ncbi:transposase [Holospora undulata]
MFLPPYSPDFNPIEKFWANMKRRIECQINAFHKLYEAFSSFFQIPSSG